MSAVALAAFLVACGSGGGSPAPVPAPNPVTISFSPPSAINVDENVETEVVVLTATASNGSSPTFAIVDTVDGAYFELRNGNELFFRAPPNFERPLDEDGDNRYEIEVSARVGSVTQTSSLTIIVRDDPEGLVVRRVVVGVQDALSTASYADIERAGLILEISARNDYYWYEPGRDGAVAQGGLWDDDPRSLDEPLGIAFDLVELEIARPGLVLVALENPDASGVRLASFSYENLNLQFREEIFVSSKRVADVVVAKCGSGFCAHTPMTPSYDPRDTDELDGRIFFFERDPISGSWNYRIIAQGIRQANFIEERGGEVFFDTGCGEAAQINRVSLDEDRVDFGNCVEAANGRAAEVEVEFGFPVEVQDGAFYSGSNRSLQGKLVLAINRQWVTIDPEVLDDGFTDREGIEFRTDDFFEAAGGRRIARNNIITLNSRFFFDDAEDIFEVSGGETSAYRAD